MAIDRYLIQRAFFLFPLPPQLEKANGFFKVSNESRPWTRIHSDEIGEIREGGGEVAERKKKRWNRWLPINRVNSQSVKLHETTTSRAKVVIYDAFRLVPGNTGTKEKEDRLDCYVCG